VTSQDQQQDRIEDQALSELYQATRREMPSSQLDREILDQAERVARSRRRRWLLPLSTAAVILLGTSLTLTLVEPPVTTSLPELEEDAVMDESEEIRQMTPAAPLRKRQVISPEASEPKVELQSVAPSSADRDGGMAAPKEKAVLERQMDAFRSATAISEGEAQAPIQSAASWIETMKALLREGDREALVKALAAFRQAYPDYPLPAELAEIETQQQ
jgi:hypothetical protein